ncbi:hypothetical protein GJV85_00690 [Sulfurimonas aquatica]|uniref:Nucleoside phosphorylase domain-containing protein n=1 Tax=Sulfurimonas aquatica TaxID=2672570 RepID=A0A975AY15_9BACT|nr:hypothetical protein [Sulfurimonas aquatica]QSZ40696.1 hypothetical protein GJV85_00690 [Sulfurimonas aquatica]
MLYFVIALKSEAQAYVDRYKLKKSKLNSFSLFENEQIRLIVSGIGVTNSRLATQSLINQYDITDDDIYINVGICGATDKYEIGTLIQIGRVTYDNSSYIFNNKKRSIVCLDEEASDTKYDIVDMESFGFYDSVIHSPAIKNFHIIKIVSDHFEPESITKEDTKALIFNQIDVINGILFTEE